MSAAPDHARRLPTLADCRPRSSTADHAHRLPTTLVDTAASGEHVADGAAGVVGERARIVGVEVVDVRVHDRSLTTSSNALPYLPRFSPRPGTARVSPIVPP